MSVTVEEIETTEDSSLTFSLTASDRCDAGDCGAQARARVVLPDGNVLLFCRHHAEKNRTALESKGLILQTQYEGL